jgi:FkbM family methyltransferase
MADGPRSDVTLRLDTGAVTVAKATWITDFSAFRYVFLQQVHGRFFDHGVVIDLGGNRGYFASYALLNGAAAVYSFEPSSGNYASLQRSRAMCDASRYLWKCQRCAVSDRDGEVDLHLSENSWHHSIYEPASQGTDMTERVPMRSFSSILNEVRATHPEAEIAVEMTIEGAEADVILGTSVERWREVSSLMFATDLPLETVSQLVAHLRRGGLERTELTDVGTARRVDHPWVLVTRTQ